jgi:hypothetical protein
MTDTPLTPEERAAIRSHYFGINHDGIKHRVMRLLNDLEAAERKLKAERELADDLFETMQNPWRPSRDRALVLARYRAAREEEGRG